MPFANNQGVRIHYEVEGQGPPLVLVTGFGFGLATWRRIGLVDALRDDYRLILVDVRAHGASDKPHDPPAYRMALKVGDVTAVLDDLGVARTHYYGYSMGGIIGFGVARFAPERLASLIVGGASTYEQDPSELPPRDHPWISQLRQGLEVWLDSLGPDLKAALSQEDLDPEALIAWLSLEERAGLSDALPALTVPSLVFVGEHDPQLDDARRSAEMMRNAWFVVIPSADHVQAGVQIDLLLPHVKRFLAEVTSARQA
jgi:pimeloyl-ACP methyl ester carboxylesterase